MSRQRRYMPTEEDMRLVLQGTSFGGDREALMRQLWEMEVRQLAFWAAWDSDPGPIARHVLEARLMLETAKRQRAVTWWLVLVTIALVIATVALVLVTSPQVVVTVQ